MVLARLSEIAGDRDGAARNRLSIARTLESRAAVGPALEQYDLALGLADDPAIRASARIERIELLVLAGRREEARADVDAVDALTDNDLDRPTGSPRPPARPDRRIEPFRLAPLGRAGARARRRIAAPG